MKVNLEIEENDLVLFPVSHFPFSILRSCPDTDIDPIQQPVTT